MTEPNPPERQTEPIAPAQPEPDHPAPPELTPPGTPYPPPGAPQAGTPYPPPGAPQAGTPYPPGMPPATVSYSPGVASPNPGYPVSGPPTAHMTYPGPDGYPGAPYPAATPRPPRKRRIGLIVGLALTVVLLLCAGGGTAAYLMVQSARPHGATAPELAVDGFLRAIYIEHSATKAAAFVCPDARDSKALNQLVQKVIDFEQKYDSPRTTWQTGPVTTAKQTATAVVRLTLKTADERVAKKQIKIELLNDRGWWVCDAQSLT